MRRFDEAVRASRRALELNPNFALAHAFLGVSLAHQGARQQAVESAQQALRLSPRDRHVGTYASITMANVNFMSGDYSECIAWACNTIENSPEWLIGHVFLTAGLAMQGDLIAAAAARDALFRLRPQFSLRWMSENQPPTGELAERLREGLSKAGVPEA
jgi:tetratricopeptide (TPR) repeat protein